MDGAAAQAQHPRDRRRRRLHLLLGLIGTLAAPAAHAGTCDGTPSTIDALEGGLDRLEAAWIDMDAAAVQHTAGELRLLTSCADAPLSPELSARLHRGFGLFLITRGSQEAAAAAFMSARRTSQALTLTDAMAPPGSVVEQLHNRPMVDLPALALDRPRTGILLADGVRADALSPGLPVVLQHLDPRGAILGTWWLPDPSQLPPEPWAGPPRSGRALARVTGVIGIATGIGALGLAGMSASAHANLDASRNERQLEAYRDASRAGTLVGSGLLLAGSTAIVISFSRARR